MDGHVGGWRKGDPFSHDLVSVGPASNPHALFLFPRRAVSVTGLAVLASLGHSGIPSHHAPPPIPLPAAVSCSLSVSIFAEAHSLAGALSFAHLPTLCHVNTSPSLMLSPILRTFWKKNPKTTSCFTGWTKVRCENNIKEDKSTYTPHSMKVKCQKYSGTENFSNASEIHSNPPRSHTLMNLYLPRLTRENIFDKQDHTVLSPPGLLCLHGNIRGVVMLLSPILDQLTLFIHFICLNGLHFFLMCISLCLFQSIYIKKHRRIIIRSIFTGKCQNDMSFTRLPKNG